MRTLPGVPYPLGATWDGEGVNFALFSENATGVELCLFEAVSNKKECHRIPLIERTNNVWHIYLPDARPGALYGYRVSGPYDPLFGHRFNPAKLLMDPYAKSIVRPITWDDSVFGYPLDHPLLDLMQDERDSAPFVPLARVVHSTFTWGEERPLRIPWHETILYETHVKGISALHPALPPELRGTYAGLGSDPIVRHLTRLGITAVELLPVHYALDEYPLVKKGLSNYWGYNTLGFFAPDPRYGSGTMDVVDEFKMMVRSLHAAGLEVILDVVYNHSAEGNHRGPTVSFRGIDNLVYYRLISGDLRHYRDYTGCGNTLNARHPHVLQMIMDSLRYWVMEMHVDGFRFDLASTLARGADAVDWHGGLFDRIQQDPVLSQVKLIAEPWDLGEGGYQVGHFPVLWKEWNDHYRDVLRSFWVGRTKGVSDLATRISGNSDLYQHGGRSPQSSINFITAHDGFTLCDLVCYNEKHNAANGEENQDGTNHNISWNSGVEGPTEEIPIRAFREQQKRNFMATLMLSQGVPMICGGDEIGRTQQGNNNAYCQDNSVSWYNWDLDPDQQAFLEWTRYLIQIRKTHPVLCRRQFFKGECESAMKDVVWFSPNGQEMMEREWHAADLRSIGMRLAGEEERGEPDEQGPPGFADPLLILMNASPEASPFVLPAPPNEGKWVLMLDTAMMSEADPHCRENSGQTYNVQSCSLVLFRGASHPVVLETL